MSAKNRPLDNCFLAQRLDGIEFYCFSTIPCFSLNNPSLLPTNYLLSFYVSRVTGFIMMKLGKAAAFTVGSGILALQLANSSGYVKINWDKLTRGVEKVAEQVEDSTSDKKKGLLKKVSVLFYFVLFNFVANFL